MEILRGEEIGVRLSRMLSTARESVRICSAWVRGDVLRELLRSLKEDVRVELILRASSYGDLEITDPDVFRTVRERGGKVYLHRRLHAKFVLVDRRSALLGSANLTRSGLSGEGNEETAVYLRDPARIRELEEIFHTLREESYDPEATVAFLIALESSREGKALLLRELQEQTYVRIPLEGGCFLLCRVSEIRSFNPALLGEAVRNILMSAEPLWKVSALFSRVGDGPEIRLARLEILGEYERERDLFKTPVRPVSAGSPVEILPPEDSALVSVLTRNHSGYPMRLPVHIGTLQGTDVRAFLDMDKVVSMHMAVLGATGSGKTTFVKKVLKNLRGSAEVYIFDMYGEYYEDLRDLGEVEEVRVPNVLLPADSEDLKRLLRESGLTLTERSADERELLSLVRKYLKPELGRTALGEKSLEAVLGEALLKVEDRHLKDAVLEALDLWRRSYGEESVSEQPAVVRALRESLSGRSRVVVYSFRDVDLTETRVNVAGLVLREILRISRERPADRLVVLEEAHNFAPERGVSEIPTGRENLAFISAKRIASEGRKLRLGLIAITQRPAGISKFILSQLNTQVIFKLITRSDLDAVSVFFERSREDIFGLLPFLKPGTAYVGGLGVPFSFLFRMEEIPYW